MTPEEKKEWAISLLIEKEKKIGRMPKKEDFDQGTRSRIKAFLGPWPRALEAAGLKPIRQRPGEKPARPVKGDVQ